MSVIPLNDGRICNASVGGVEVECVMLVVI